jgi:GntR family transcriptional regulator / MocR family aminotransferase
MVPAVLPLRLDEGAPLYRQCYDVIRGELLAGRLRPGARLPSTRLLAAEHGVSRNTVSLAFDQLRAEGYIEARHRAGTFVTAALPDALLRVRPGANVSRETSAAALGNVSRETSAAALGNVSRETSATARELAALPRMRAFQPGPALDAFPARLWARLLAREWRRPVRLMGYGNPKGHGPLRRAIAEHVAVARGAQCEAEQVIVVAGSQQGLALAARVLLAPRDRVWVEDPGYHGTRAALAAAGARVVPVPVDGEGLIVREGIARAPRARAVCLTPSHQYPLGGTMSIARRLAVLEWAVRADAWVIEDDYDSDFRYTSRPLPCVQGFDARATERVVYVGTFSKTMFPALRLGFLIVPPALIDRFAEARYAMDRHSPTVEQAVLAAFIAEGHYARHVRRMRAVYAERQAALVEAGRSVLAPYLSIEPSGAGLHLVGWMHRGLRAGLTDTTVARAARESGVDVQPLSGLTGGRSGLLLGYAAYTPGAIRGGAERLADVLRRL